MLGLGNEIYRGGYTEATPYASVRALSFDGTDDMVFYTDDDDWHGGSNNGFTISFWLKQGTYNTRTVLSKYQDGNNVWKIHILRNGNAMVFDMIEGGVLNCKITTDDAVSTYAGAYTHYVISVRTDSGNAFETGSFIMINGVNVDVTFVVDAAFDQAHFNNTGAPSWAAASTSRFAFDQLDEFAAWNNNISQSAAQAMYNGGTPIDLTKSSGNYTGANGPDSLHAWVRGEKNFGGVDTELTGTVNNLGTDDAGKGVFSLGNPTVVAAG